MTEFYNALAELGDAGHELLLCGGLKGLEKESLRLSSNGLISQTNHPVGLGSALTHPFITTDYSEALIELITPPFTDITETLAYLCNIHSFVYQHLDDEVLLASSMPCGVDGDDSIRIAEYGTSNIGRMKHIYRHGLWHRYGRTMQAIAGIHFNYSVPEAFWPVWLQLNKSPLSLDEFKAAGYFGLIRNFQRIGWIILYLFGASPAICKAFFNSRPELKAPFEQFDDDTLYHPYATSLRMSDIGYKSKNQASLKINYDSLSGYVASLCHAITTPYPDYQAIGVEVNGEYRQLNGNILQIENEFYSTIRPKQIAESCERPTRALKRRGVRYIEMRSLDLDLFCPLGIDEDKARFIEALLLCCLIKESPNLDNEEQAINNANQLAVAHEGRKPGLLLQRGQQQIALQDWGHEILAMMEPICEILDRNQPSKPYTTTLIIQKQCLDNPDLTSSAKMLKHMGQHRISYSQFAFQQSLNYAEDFRNKSLVPTVALHFNQLAEESLQKQKDIESKPQQPFGEFLNCYFSQTCS